MIFLSKNISRRGRKMDLGKMWAVAILGRSKTRRAANCSWMQRPRIDDELVLLTDNGRTTAICIEVKDDPTLEKGTLVRVMTRGTFEEGQQCWLIGSDGTKIGATVRGLARLTADSEVLLAANFS